MEKEDWAKLGLTLLGLIGAVAVAGKVGTKIAKRQIERKAWKAAREYIEEAARKW